MPMKKLVVGWLETRPSSLITESSSFESTALVITPSFGSNLCKVEACKYLVSTSAGFLSDGVLAKLKLATRNKILHEQEPKLNMFALSCQPKLRS